jgi:hypothetical protein
MQNLQETEGIGFISGTNAIDPGPLISCFAWRSLRHLPPEETTEALGRIARVLSDDGHLVVGVPIEVGIPALYKGAFRMTRRWGAFDATLTNIVACAFGRPPLERPISEIGDGMWYHHHHVGFDHRRFRSTLSASFDIKAARATPVPVFGAYVNPELYFVAQRRAATPVSTASSTDLSHLRGAA